MNRKAKGAAFKMKSGNTTEFKSMGSSPVKAVSPSYYSNLMANLQTPTPTIGYAPSPGLTPSAPTLPTSVTTTRSGNAVPDSPVYLPPTGPIGPTPPTELIQRDPIRTGDPQNGSTTGSTTASDKPNNQLAKMNLDLESEVLDKIEAPDYDADEGSGSLYDYSVRKKASAITKRLPKGKRGFKMKRK